MPNFTEFNSVIVTVDHLTARTDEHVAQKFVMSTENMNQTMLALFKYYEEENLLASEATLEMFQLASASKFPAFVYRTRENIQIVMNMDTFDILVAMTGSLLGATQNLLDSAARAMIQTDEAKGGVTPLCLCCFESEEVKDPAAAVDATDTNT